MRFFVPEYDIYRTDRQGETTVAVLTGIPHTCMDLSLPLSLEAKGVCIPTTNTEMLVAAVHKSPQGLWNDTDITEVLGFRNNSYPCR
jgi:hypothetical protein